MEKIFSTEQISKILDQSVIYQCACPAQVCEHINQSRHLFEYQAGCLNLTHTDHLVHQRIAESARRTHAEMEACLIEILQLEGWNMDTLEMPDSLKARILQNI